MEEVQLYEYLHNKILREYKNKDVSLENEKQEMEQTTGRKLTTLTLPSNGKICFWRHGLENNTVVTSLSIEQSKWNSKRKLYIP